MGCEIPGGCFLDQNNLFMIVSHPLFWIIFIIDLLAIWWLRRVENKQKE